MKSSNNSNNDENNRLSSTCSSNLLVYYPVRWSLDFQHCLISLNPQHFSLDSYSLFDFLQHFCLVPNFQSTQRSSAVIQEKEHILRPLPKTTLPLLHSQLNNSSNDGHALWRPSSSCNRTDFQPKLALLGLWLNISLRKLLDEDSFAKAFLVF